MTINPTTVDGHVLIESKWYPTKSSLRASTPTHSQDCPIPLESLETIEPITNPVDVEVRAGNGDYCHNSCEITDCPTYQNIKGE